MRCFSLLLAFLYMIQGNAQQYTDTIRLDQGLLLIKRTNEPGTKITYGNRVLAHFDTWLKDSLMNSSRLTFKRPREVNIPDSSIHIENMPALLKAMFWLTTGDSATCLEPITPEKAALVPASLGKVTHIRLEIKVLEVLDHADIIKREAEKKQRQNETITESKAVEQLLAEKLKLYKAKQLGDELQKSRSGLEYIILDIGSGAKVEEGDAVLTHYLGMLKSNGKVFDSSYQLGEPALFTVGSLVPGFNEGMKRLRKGGKAILFIPHRLAYGDEAVGPLPPRSNLVFYLHLVDR